MVTTQSPARKAVLGSGYPLEGTPTLVSPNKTQGGRSLEELAQNRLKDAGWQIAAAWDLRLRLERILRQQEVQNPGALAVGMATTLDYLFRVDGVEKLKATGYQGVMKQAAKLLLDQLHAEQLEPPGRLFWRAASISGMPVFPVHLRGFVQLDPGELAFLNDVAGPGSVVELPYRHRYWFANNLTTVQELARHGWELIELDWPPANAAWEWDRQGWTVHRFADQESEVRAVLAQVAQLPKSEVALVARNPERYRPLVQEVAWEYGLDLQTPLETGLERTQLGQWLQLLAEMLNREFAHQPTVAWFTHVAQQGQVPPEVMDRIGRLGSTGAQAWQAEVSLEGFTWPNRATPAQYADWLTHLMQQTPWLDSLAEEKPLLSTLKQILLRQKAATEPLSRQEFLDQLGRTLNRAITPPDPEPGRLALRSPLELAGTQFAHLFWLGAVDGELPALIAEDPLLPFIEREEGLEGAEQAARREWLSIWAALQVAPQVHFSCPRQWAGSAVNRSSGTGLVPSSLLEGLAPASYTHRTISPEEIRQAAISSLDQQDDPVLKRAAQALVAEKARRSSEPGIYGGDLGQALKVEDFRFSASQLENLGQCAFRWLAGNYLKLGETITSSDEIQASTRGSILHNALDFALKKAKDQPDFLAAVHHHLEESLIEAVEAVKKERNPLPTTLLWEFYLHEMLETLHKVVDEPNFWQPGRRVLDLEYRFVSEWRGLKFSGVVDRIDLEDDQLILVDYKSSASAPKGVKDVSGDLKVDLQLPIYRSVVPTLETTPFYGKEVREAYYFSLANGKKFGAKTSDGPEQEAFVQRVLEYFAQGQFPVNPDKKRVACQYCDYKALCRIGGSDESESVAETE
jgi:hypothetical protein